MQTSVDKGELLDRVQKQLGRVPNLYASMAEAPAALEGYLAMRDQLGRGVLRARVREQLALLVAQENDCTYCVSAHSLRGGTMGLSNEELLATRDASDADPHTRALLALARELIRTRGRIGDETRALIDAAGVTDAEAGEVVAHVALNTLSNYYNHLARPELDFPEVKA
ncbi:carboxymuconolactone decarboxylase family protein [Streptomyces sp. CB01881]|uniref:carboxymuconolactone decarboxylase family protein n=1 Tax=Streptomyces sp. CB01881 TaxID=2078691 RepID=UPI001F11B2C0|nr:carboxymuconolactone decarboxylase family protein [Streptomyces sp. CB01881]